MGASIEDSPEQTSANLLLLRKTFGHDLPAAGFNHRQVQELAYNSQGVILPLLLPKGFFFYIEIALGRGTLPCRNLNLRTAFIQEGI